LSQAQIDELAALLEPTDAWILTDEVYAKIVYDGDAPSLASHPGLRERTVLLDSCSKTFAMTGWRCGFAAVPAPLRDPLTRFFINSTSCVPPFVQRAAVAALTGPMDGVETMVRTFRARRDAVVAGLNRLPGVRCRVPQGAFYAFPDVSGTGLEAAELAERLLVEAGVAVLAGSAFGECRRAAADPGGARADGVAAGTGILLCPHQPVIAAVIVIRSAHSHAETMRRLTAAVQERGLTVFALIDHAAAAREAGLQLADEQVLVFGNPRAGTALMQDDPRVGIELPLRMLVWAGDDGVCVGHGDPRALADRYAVGAHQATLEAMATLLGELAATAAGAP